jgi:hypothetical protein
MDVILTASYEIHIVTSQKQLVQNSFTSWDRQYTRLQTGLPSDLGSTPNGKEIFLFSIMSRPALGPTQPPIQWVPRAVSLRVKRPPACLLVLAELISSTLKTEAIFSSETSVETQRTTRLHIPEDDTLHNHRCENLKSHVALFVWKFVYFARVSAWFIDWQ